MLLDTSFVIDVMRESNAEVEGPATEQLRSLGSARLRSPLFALCELQAAVAAARDPERERARLEQAVQYIEIVYPGPGFATLYGQSAAELQRRGTPVPTMDLLIATISRAEAEPILTRDAEHFSRVPGVTVARS